MSHHQALMASTFTPLGARNVLPSEDGFQQLPRMRKPFKTQGSFGELFPQKTVRQVRRTPTGGRNAAQHRRSAAEPTLGLAHQMNVPCRGTGTTRASTRFLRPLKAAALIAAGSQGSAARNPGLYYVAPLGQGDGPKTCGYCRFSRNRHFNAKTQRRKDAGSKKAFSSGSSLRLRALASLR